MQKRVLIVLFILIPAVLMHAQAYSFSPEDFWGEWEVQMLFEINSGVMSSDGAPDYTLYDYFTITFMGDGKAIIQRDGSGSTELSWYADDFVLTLLYPDDGDFQYTAFYQYAAADFGTVAVALYDMFFEPRVGIMKRLSMAF